MKLQVLPLTVLATREVVRNRMDYFTFVNGTTKDELDGLGRLAGNYKIHASKITIGAENMLDGENILVFSSPSSRQVSDWERFKEAYEGTLRTDVIDFIDGKEEQDKVNTADSAFIFFIILLISQNKWSGWSGQRRWSCLVWSLLYCLSRIRKKLYIYPVHVTTALQCTCHAKLIYIGLLVESRIFR